MKIGVLDQSPIISGYRSVDALRATIELAQRAEQLGYARYWLAEHHAIAALADPCPEILVGRVAAATSSIRVGTGGVLLPYYSPLKVAEVFRMLEALFPGRIDLGLGRAPGGDMRTAKALSGGRYDAAENFPQQVYELAAYLHGSLAADHPFAQVRVMPEIDTAPDIWLLGSSDYSAALACQLGLPFAFAHFINGHGGDGVTRAYRDQYRASPRAPQPRAMVCTFVVCAQRSEDAERLAQCIDLRRLQMALGIDSPIPTLAEAEARQYTAQERAYIAQQRVRAVIGNPAQVRQQLEALRERFEADELMVLTITGDYESRLESYKLVAQSFELS
jgi:luciferase family oxidoreductase group 1